MIAQEKVMNDPALFVGVVNLNDGSVDLVVRPYFVPEHCWDVYLKTLENAKLVLDAADISIPFPQRNVHMIPVT